MRPRGTFAAAALLCLAMAPARLQAAGDEPLDGRAPASDPKKGALLIPRLLLTPPKVLLRGVAQGARVLLNFEERHAIILRVLDAITSDDGLVGVRLAFEFALDFRPMVGFSFFHDRLLGPNTAFGVQLMGNTPDLVAARAHVRPLQRGRALLELDGSYIRRDDQIFRGIASISPPDVLLLGARFKLEAFDVAVRSRVRLTPIFSLALSLGYGMRNYGDGRSTESFPAISKVYCVRDPNGFCLRPQQVDDRVVPGFTTGTHFMRGGLGMRVDSRDNPYRPTRGVLFDVDGSYTHGLADRSSYFRISSGFSGVINLYRRTHVLVLRAYAEMTLPTNDAPVPFTELTKLGGPDDLRGFTWGRFRDFSALLATVEYRWDIWMWADALLFVDYGGTFGIGYRDFQLDKLQPNVGVGIRMRTSRRVYLRFQLAYGWPDGVQVYVVSSAGP